MQIEKLFAATGARLAFIYSVLLIASFSIAIALTWFAARSAAESDLRDRITLEVAALRAEIHDEGIAAAVGAIKARAERPGAFEYWLVDANGNLLSGDLALAATPDGWQHLRIPDAVSGADGRDELLVLTAMMPDGSRLSVGDELGRAESVRDAVLESLLWIAIATVALALVAGVFATRRTLTQIDALTSIVRAVAAGRLDARIDLRKHSNPNDLERLGDSINQMLDHIDRLVRNLRRVSRDLAHDLRKPLSHVQQRLEKARSAYTADERLSYIDAAEDKMKEVLQAFDAILRLAEIEAGAAQSRFVDVDISALVERLVDAYRPDVEASGRSIRIEDTFRAQVRGDNELLSQAVANLIENSIRHTPVGTRIALSTRHDGESVGLIVSDNGPGIPPDRRSDVLEPYLRLDMSRSTSGFGLGMSIVAAIARLHQAKLDLDDNDPGLKVTLTFTAREPFDRTA